MSAISEEQARGGSLFSDGEATEIESMCMSCHRDGVTRLLLTRIPFFKEVVVSSFSCPHCQWANTETQAAGRIQEQGVCYALRVRGRRDLDREVVRADSAATRIPEVQLEIPAFTQKGCLSTVEGILDRAVAGLDQEQPARRAAEPRLAEQIDAVIQKLRRLKRGEEEFTLVIEDPSGNSFVENPVAPQRDDALTVSRFTRTAQQDAQLGLRADEEPQGAGEEDRDQDQDRDRDQELDDMRNEVLVFATNCPECNAAAATNMKLVQIPHFKEVVLMATTCDSCGHRTNEVKSGGATEEMGTRITLRVTEASDMTRDVLKSETCSVHIPELQFELGMALLGGKFTTLEGLLRDIKDAVVTRNPFVCGDSAAADRLHKLEEFGRKMDQVLAGELRVHVVLDDPAGNSYLQNVYAPEPDPQMSVEKYRRSFQQNEDLGLNDMKTEDYQESS